jgi:phytol kinase
MMGVKYLGARPQLGALSLKLLLRPPALHHSQRCLHRNVGRLCALRANLQSPLDSQRLRFRTNAAEGEEGYRAEVGVEGGGSGQWPAVPLVQHDVGVTVAVLVGAWAWVRVFDFLTKQKYLGQKLSRKLVHISSGLLFASCWPLYSAFPWAQYIAALVPVSNGVRLLVYGLGVLKDDGLVQSVSREGDPRELLRGPLYYVAVLVFSTVLFWRDSPVGVMALAMMCGGDGVADIVGRRFGASKLPYNPGKSWAGSLAMFLFGSLVSYASLSYFSLMGFYHLDTGATLLLRLAMVSLAATVVESLPISTKLDDNVTVPLTTIIMGMLLFPSTSTSAFAQFPQVNLM